MTESHVPIGTRTVRIPPRHAGTALAPATMPLAANVEVRRPQNTTLNDAIGHLIDQIETLRSLDLGPLTESQAALVDGLAQAARQTRETMQTWLADERQRAVRALAPGAMRPVDIGAVLDRATRAFSLAWRSNATEIVLAADEDVPLLSGNPDQLHEAVLLLLEECTRGGVDRVDARIDGPANGNVTVFIQGGTHAARGACDPERLDVVRRILEAHGGALVDEGTAERVCFRLTLPIPQAK